MYMEQIRYIKLFWNELEQAANELGKSTLPELKEEEFNLFFKTGNRLIYEKAYFRRRKYLTVYGILAVYRRKQEDIDRITEIISAVCEEQFWALPAHVDAKKRDELTIDLFATETAQTLSEIVFLLYNKLPKTTVEKVFREIKRRVLVPFLSSTVPYSWWETDRCNWSAVCGGSIGMTAIYMNRMKQFSDDEKEVCIQRACNALDCYLSGMEEDGACTEGLGYYSYGMSYYTAFAELLYQDSNETIDLMKKPKCENIAAFQQKCYFGGGISVSFSDGSSKEPFLPGLTTYLAHCFPQVEAPDYALARGLEGDACYRWLTNERNIRWTIEYDKQFQNRDVCDSLGKILASDFGGEKRVEEKRESKGMTCYLLPSAQWMICKDVNGNGFAAKGGHNDENHNHNDVGHFLCVYDGEMLLTDLGAGEYTKDYFGDKRYQILCNRSMGHSVPIINGLEQESGRDHGATDFSWNKEKKELTLFFGAAYPKDCVKDVVRRIHIEECEELSLHVTDTFYLSENTQEIVENLVTIYEPVVDKNTVLIKGTRGECIIEVKGMKPKTFIQVIPRKHSNHEGKEETVYLIQWNIPIQKNMDTECSMCITLQKETDNI